MKQTEWTNTVKGLNVTEYKSLIVNDIAFRTFFRKPYIVSHSNPGLTPARIEYSLNILTK